MEAGESAAAKTLREVVKSLKDGEQKLAEAAGELNGDDRAEVELLAEEMADVRVRVDAAADRA